MMVDHMNFKRINDEVYYWQGDVNTIDAKDLELLKEIALNNPRQRARLCTHKDENDSVHEMFIIHGKDTYVRPHKHLNKVESFQVLEGEVTIILFDDQGNVTQTIKMGPAGSGKPFYFKISDATFHSLYIHTPLLTFKEVTNGPFKREDTVFATWSPEEKESEKVAAFRKTLEKRCA